MAIKCPNCGNDKLDKLGVDAGTGDTTFGCPKCHIWFTIYGEQYDPNK